MKFVTKYFHGILVVWFECRFLVTEVDGSNPCCFLEQDALSALLQSTQL